MKPHLMLCGVTFASKIEPFSNAMFLKKSEQCGVRPLILWKIVACMKKSTYLCRFINIPISASE